MKTIYQTAIPCWRMGVKGLNALLKLIRLPVLMGALLTAAGAAQAPVDLRVALVIGNSDYPKSALANPVNDAKAMGETLRGLGFTVLELRDADKKQMVAAVSKMGDVLKEKHGIGMLYYAGHGLQMDWHNYMIPVSAKLTTASDVVEQTVDLASVIAAFRGAGNRMNILVLDACRDNPFSATLGGKGLAPMDAPNGTILAYATAPGNVAADGEENGNGLYTHYLLQELKKPATRIEDVFKRVRLNVRKQSDGRQIPWESTSLEEDFYFNDGKVESRVKRNERIEFETTYADEKAAWDAIKDSRNASDFYAFLSKYPSGYLSEPAQFKLDQIQKPRVMQSTDREGVQALRSGQRRYHLGDELITETTDGFTKEVRRMKGKVTFADDDTVEINHGAVIMDQMGGYKKNRFGTKDPALLLAPADIALGKTWRSAFTNVRPDGVKEENYWDNKVLALEEISALGGKVKAYKVERKGQARFAGGFTTLEGTYWVDPATMHVIRSDVFFRNERRIVQFDSMVTVSYKPASR